MRLIPHLSPNYQSYNHPDEDKLYEAYTSFVTKLPVL